MEEREIAAFLGRVHTILDEHGFVLWPREKNNAFRKETGFKYADVKRVLQALHPRDYQWGPREDDTPSRTPGEVWAFAPEYAGYDLWVKLKLPDGQPPIVECISFHEAESPPTRPGWRPR